MNNERELLKKCAVQLNSTLNGTTSMRLAEEIEEILAKPETEQYPVVWMYCEPTTGLVYFENSGKMEHGWVPLYTAPPAPKPLSDEEIYDLDNEVNGFVGKVIVRGVMRWIRAVEKAHGIGVK